jgi:SAM-dependent methyltransferase
MRKSACSVYFDAPRSRLVYIGQAADEGYWDSHWLANLKADYIRQPNRFVVDVTRRFLPKGAKVVDAGCGLARTVYGLHQAGYDAYGIDFAPETVAAINRVAPELKVSVADVRDMGSFPDGYFDGVWSLGVIEHFYDGYDAILKETHRLIRPGGNAFVTVPSMSPLRRFKAKLGAYTQWNGQDRDAFYQFVLPHEAVARSFEGAGFKLLSTEGCAGFKGFKDEAGPLLPLLQFVYDSKATPMRALRVGLDQLLRPLTFHTKLYVFQKL